MPNIAGRAFVKSEKVFFATFVRTAKTVIKPGPAITFLIPFNKPFAKTEPTPSPSKVSFIYSTASLMGATIDLKIGSNVTFPMFEPNCCKPVEV